MLAFCLHIISSSNISFNSFLFSLRRLTSASFVSFLPPFSSPIHLSLFSSSFLRLMLPNDALFHIVNVFLTLLNFHVIFLAASLASMSIDQLFAIVSSTSSAFNHIFSNLNGLLCLLSNTPVFSFNRTWSDVSRWQYCTVARGNEFPTLGIWKS